MSTLKLLLFRVADRLAVVAVRFLADAVEAELRLLFHAAVAALRLALKVAVAVLRLASQSLEADLTDTSVYALAEASSVVSEVLVVEPSALCSTTTTS